MPQAWDVTSSTALVRLDGTLRANISVPPRKSAATGATGGALQSSSGALLSTRPECRQGDRSAGCPLACSPESGLSSSCGV